MDSDGIGYWSFANGNQPGPYSLGAGDTISMNEFHGVLRFSGPVQMRADDHQLLKGLYISRWQKTDDVFPKGAEGTDHTFAPVQFLPGSEIGGETTCRMQRP